MDDEDLVMPPMGASLTDDDLVMPPMATKEQKQPKLPRLPANMNPQQVRQFFSRAGKTLTDTQANDIAGMVSGKSYDEAMSLTSNYLTPKTTAPVQEQAPLVAAPQPGTGFTGEVDGVQVNTTQNQEPDLSFSNVATEIARPKTVAETEANIAQSMVDEYKGADKDLTYIFDAIDNGKLSGTDLNPFLKIGLSMFTDFPMDSDIFGYTREQIAAMGPQQKETLKKQIRAQKAAQKTSSLVTNYATIKSLQEESTKNIASLINEVNSMQEDPTHDPKVLEKKKTELYDQAIINQVSNNTQPFEEQQRLKAIANAQSAINALPRSVKNVLFVKNAAIDASDYSLGFLNSVGEFYNKYSTEATADKIWRYIYDVKDEEFGPSTTAFGTGLKELTKTKREEIEAYKKSNETEYLAGQVSILDGLNAVNVGKAVGQTVGSMVPVILGSMAGGAAGGVAVGYSLVYGDAVDTARKAGYNEIESEIYGQIMAIGTGLLEELPVGKLLDGWANTMLKKSVLNLIKTELRAGTPKATIIKNVVDQTLEMTVKGIQQGIPEGATEVIQGGQEYLTQLAFNNYLKEKEDPGFELPTLKQFGKQSAEAFVLGFFGGGGASVAGDVFSGSQSYAKLAQSAIRDNETFNNLNLVADALMTSGKITQQERDSFVGNLKIAQEAKAALPKYIKDDNIRQRSIELILQKKRLEADMATVDPSMQDGYKTKLASIQAELRSVADRKWKAPANPVLFVSVSGLEATAFDLVNSSSRENSAGIFVSTIESGKGFISNLINSLDNNTPVAKPMIDRTVKALEEMANSFATAPVKTEMTQKAAQQAQELADQIKSYKNTPESIDAAVIPGLDISLVADRIALGVPVAELDFMGDIPTDIQEAYQGIVNGDEVSSEDSNNVQNVLYAKYKELSDVKQKVQDKLENTTSKEKQRKLSDSINAISEIQGKLSEDLDMLDKYTKETRINEEATGKTKPTKTKAAVKQEAKKEQAKPVQKVSEQELADMEYDYSDPSDEIASMIDDQPDSAKIYKLLNGAIKFINKIAPNVKVYVHATTKEFYDAIDSTSGSKQSRLGEDGMFVMDRDTKEPKAVHFNLEVILGKTDPKERFDALRTFAHEAMHVGLHTIFGNDQKIFQQFQDRLGKILNSADLESLNDFVERYKGTTYSAEEFLAELGGMMAAEGRNIPKPIMAKIAELINNTIVSFAKAFGKQLDPNELLFKDTMNVNDIINFFNAMAESARTGVLSDKLKGEEKNIVPDNEGDTGIRPRSTGKKEGTEKLKTTFGQESTAKKNEINQPTGTGAAEPSGGPAKGNRLFNKPLKKAKEIADKYYESTFGRKAPNYTGTRYLDTKNSKRISDAFIAMKHEPQNLEVAKAYRQMIRETEDQFKAIIDAGYSIIMDDNASYNSSEDMINDLRDNKKLDIYSTEAGFGDTPITDKQRRDNPLLAETKYKDANGRVLLANDLFRFVHDFFGHSELGNSFGPKGEENAWNVHARMYSPLARRAMTTETRGQNSFVNFSGTNDKIRDLQDLAIQQRKDGDDLGAEVTAQKIIELMTFAEQKVGLMPEEFSQIDETNEGDRQEELGLPVPTTRARKSSIPSSAPKEAKIGSRFDKVWQQDPASVQNEFSNALNKFSSEDTKENLDGYEKALRKKIQYQNSVKAAFSAGNISREQILELEKEAPYMRFDIDNLVPVGNKEVYHLSVSASDVMDDGFITQDELKKRDGRVGIGGGRGGISVTWDKTYAEKLLRIFTEIKAALNGDVDIADEFKKLGSKAQENIINAIRDYSRGSRDDIRKAIENNKNTYPTEKSYDDMRFTLSPGVTSEDNQRFNDEKVDVAPSTFIKQYYNALSIFSDLGDREYIALFNGIEKLKDADIGIIKAITSENAHAEILPAEREYHFYSGDAIQNLERITPKAEASVTRARGSEEAKPASKLVKDTDVNDIGLQGEINTDNTRPRRDSRSLLSSGDIKRFPVNENAKVQEDIPLSNFNGKKTNLIESDRMTGGYLSDAEGNPLFKFYGGVYYPIITGKWWASRNETKAKAIVENGNKNRDADGYVYCTPMIGSDRQHMSNTDMLSVTVELMKHDVKDKKSKVKKVDIISSLQKAFNRKDVLNKKELLSSITSKSKNINEIFDELEYVLFQEGDKIFKRDGSPFVGEKGKAISNFSFEERLAIVNTLLGDPKVKDVKFPSAGTISDAAKRFEEPVTSKAKAIGDVVTVMRTKGTLEYKKSEVEDKFYHKSYPVEINAVDENGNPAEIEVYVLDGAYSMKDVFPLLTQSSGKEFTWNDYIEKHKSDALAASQYNRTAKLSSATGEITTRARKTKSDITFEPIDFENESENIDVYEASNDAEKIAKDNGVNILRGKELRGVALNKNGDVIGGLWTEVSGDKFSFDIAIDKSSQGKGAGEQLVNEAISEFKGQNYEDQLKYKIDVTNPIMEKLLSKYGFEVVERIPGHTMMEHPTNNPKLKPQSETTTRARRPQVDKVFQDNPELASIGTPDQYSQYLDGVFPESQLKDIFYHGSSNKFTEFRDPSSSGLSHIWFSEKPLIGQYGNYIYPVILDIKSPLSEWSPEYRKEINLFEAAINPERNYALTGELAKYKYDSTIRSSRVDNGKSITVRNPKQIHILGSRKDIDGFKSFVNSETTTRSRKSQSSKQYYNPDQAADQGTKADRDNQVKIYDMAKEFIDNYTASGGEAADTQTALYIYFSDNGIDIDANDLLLLRYHVSKGDRPKFAENKGGQGYAQREGTETNKSRVIDRIKTRLEKLATDKRLNRRVVDKLKDSLYYTVENQDDAISIAQLVVDEFGGIDGPQGVQELFDLSNEFSGAVKTFIVGNVLNEAYRLAKKAAKGSDDQKRYETIVNDASTLLAERARDNGREIAALYKLFLTSPEGMYTIEAKKFLREVESSFTDKSQKASIDKLLAELKQAKDDAARLAIEVADVKAAIASATGGPVTTPPPASPSRPPKPKAPSTTPTTPTQQNLKKERDLFSQLKDRLKALGNTRARRQYPAGVDADVVDILSELSRVNFERGIFDFYSIKDAIAKKLAKDNLTISDDHYREMWNDIWREAGNAQIAYNAEILAKRIVAKAKMTQPSTPITDPIKLIKDELFKRATQEIDDFEVTPETEFDKLKSLLMQYSTMTKPIWNESKAAVERQIEALDPTKYSAAAKAELKRKLDRFFNDTLANALPRSQKKITDTFKEEVKNQQLKIQEVLLKPNDVIASTKEEFVSDLVDKLVSQTGITYSEAQAIANAFSKEYDAYAQKTAEKVLARSIPRKKSKEKIFRKSSAERAFEMIKYGAIEFNASITDKDGNLTDLNLLFSEMFGLPKMTAEIRDNLKLFAEQIAKTKPNSILRQQFYNDMMMYIEFQKIRDSMTGDILMAQIYNNVLLSMDTMMKAFNSNIINMPFEFATQSLRAAFEGDFRLIGLMAKSYFGRKGEKGTEVWFREGMNNAKLTLAGMVETENFNTINTAEVLSKQSDSPLLRAWGKYARKSGRYLGAIDTLLTAAATNARISDLMYDEIKYLANLNEVEISNREIVDAVAKIQGVRNAPVADAIAQATDEFVEAYGTGVDINAKDKISLFRARVMEIVREGSKDRAAEFITRNGWASELDGARIEEITNTAKELASKIGLVGTPPGTWGILANIIKYPGARLPGSQVLIGNMFANAPMNAAEKILQGNLLVGGSVLAVRLLKNQRGILNEKELTRKLLNTEGVRTEMYGRVTSRRMGVDVNMEKKEMIARFALIQTGVLPISIMATNAVISAIAKGADDDEEKAILKDNIKGVGEISENRRHMIFFGDKTASPRSKEYNGQWEKLGFYVTGPMYGYTDPGAYSKMTSLKSMYGVEPYCVYRYGKLVMRYNDNPLLAAVLGGVGANSDIMLFNNNPEKPTETWIQMTMQSAFLQLNLVKDQAAIKPVMELLDAALGKGTYGAPELENWADRLWVVGFKKAGNLFSNLTIPAEAKNFNQDMKSFYGAAATDPRAYYEYALVRAPIMDLLINKDKTDSFNFPIEEKTKRVLPVGTQGLLYVRVADGSLSFPQVDQIMNGAGGKYYAMFKKYDNDQFDKPGIFSYIEREPNNSGGSKAKTLSLDQRNLVRDEYKKIMREFCDQNYQELKSGSNKDEFKGRLNLFLAYYKENVYGYKDYILKKVVGENAFVDETTDEQVENAMKGMEPRK